MPNMYGAVALTGNTVGCLDKIDGAILNEGDTAIVIPIGSYVFHYILYPNLGGTPDGLWVIAPATNAGNKRWVLRAPYYVQYAAYAYEWLGAAYTVGTGAPSGGEDGDFYFKREA